MSPAPSGSPSDLNLSGTTAMIVSANLTVRNITVQDNATLYVHSPTKRVTLTVLGNIRLSGKGLLFVNASNLAIGEAYDVEWNLQMTGHSRFVVAYANVTTNGYQWGAAYEGNSNVTVISSLVGYPSGWLDTELVGQANLTVLYSWYSSDVILFDNPFTPSTANFSAGDSAGFNIWLNFKSGARANLTLPGLQGWRNWTFPGAAQVSGLNYSVRVVNCYVLVFAVMLWQGSNLTIVNSPDVVMALNLDAGSLVLSGLVEGHYPHFALASDGLALRLWNTSIFTWNIYPFGGSVAISHSQVGEIQQFGAATTRVVASNLTARGGYYGNQGSSTLTITDSQVHGQVVGYSGSTSLVNCTIASAYPSRVLATGSASVYALDTSLAPQDTYQTLSRGIVRVAWSVHTNLSLSGSPVRGASVSVRFSSNGSLAASGTSDPSGAWATPLVGAVLTNIGWSHPGYTVATTFQDDLGTLTLAQVTGVEWTAIPLLPIVQSTTPGNGSTSIALNPPPIVIAFGFSMNPSTTQAAVSIRPSVPLAPAWDPLDRNLTLTPSRSLDAGTTYTVVIAANASTGSGSTLAVPYTFDFTTRSAVAPLVTAVLPMNGSTNVSRNASVWVTFDGPMNGTSLRAAFSIAPGAPSGSVNVSSSVLEWTPSAPLAFDTTYTVTLSTSAQSSTGTPLAHPVTFWFRTASATGPNMGGPPHGPSTNGSAGGPPTWLLLGLALGGTAALVAGAIVWWTRRPPPRPPGSVASPAAGLPTASARLAPLPPDWSEEPDPAAPSPPH
jgi:hypothetical protein